MKYRINILLTGIFVAGLLLVAGTGCGTAEIKQSAAANEAERKNIPGTRDSARGEATSSEKRGAVAQAGEGKAVANSGEAEASAGNGEARAGDAVAGNGKARAGNVVAGDGKGRESGNGSLPGKVILRIGGDLGAKFSGTCTVGGEEKDVTGRVPGRFAYDLDEQKLECEIRKVEPASSALDISVNAGGLRRETVVRGQGYEVSFSLTDQGTAFSTFSSSESGGSVNQKMKITSSSSSSVSSSSESR